MIDTKKRNLILIGVIFGIVLLTALVIFISVATAPTSFKCAEREDGTYDVQVETLKMFSDTVTVPAEYNGKQITSFLMGGKDGYYSPVVYVDGEERGALYDIKTIILSEGIEEVNINHLDCYPNLEKIELPSTIRRIEGSLEMDVEIVFENNDYVELVSGCFIEKATKTVTGATHYAEIPEGIKVIGRNAFWGLNLKNIKIPTSVEKIEYGAFAYVSVEEAIDLTFSSNIQFVGDMAFRAPLTINKLTISTSAPLHSEIFGDDEDGATIKSIVLDVKPFIVYGTQESHSNAYQFSINGEKNGEALKYLYISNSVTGITQPIMFGEVESDIAGYKKYDYDKYENEDGYTIITYSFSASGY